jgi:DNA-binding MarR family transcriptional regulator
MKKQGLSPTQLTAWANYERMRVRLAERINREIAQKAGLSEADFEILSALIESPDDSMRALALRCGLEWEKSRLSHQLRRMEERDLIIRQECPEDNRSSLICVTETGRKLANEAKVCYEQAVRQYVVDVLTAEQLQALGSIADKVINRLEESHKP